jgi:hypothetical protein
MTNPQRQAITKHVSSRPRSVTVALWLNVAGFVAAGVILVASLFSVALPVGEHQSVRWLVLAMLLVVFALFGGLLAALFHRRRWAWWVWLVLSVIALPSEWSGLQHSLDQNALGVTRYVLLTAVSVAATVLLLLRPAREWYGIGRKRSEPSSWQWSDSPKEP